MKTELYALRTPSYWLSGIGVSFSRDYSLSSIIGAVGGITYLYVVVSPHRYTYSTLSPNQAIIPVSIIPGRHQRNSWNLHAAGSSSRHIPISAQAAHVGLVLGRGGTELVRVISEEEPDGASLMTWLSLEYIELHLSRLPRGSIRTAGTLEVFFDFLILVEDIRMSWSSSTVSYHCRDSLIYLSNRVHEAASRFLIPTLVRGMIIIIFLAISDTKIRHTLFGFESTFYVFP